MKKKTLRVTFKPHRFALKTDFEIYENDLPHLIRRLINIMMDKQTKFSVKK